MRLLPVRNDLVHGFERSAPIDADALRRLVDALVIELDRGA